MEIEVYFDGVKYLVNQSEGIVKRKDGGSVQEKEAKAILAFLEELDREDLKNEDN